MRTRFSFGDVIPLVLRVGLVILSLTHRQRLLATLLERPHTLSQHLLPLSQSHN